MAHSKADRYPRQPQRPGPRMRVDGHDLGFAMLPNDLLIALRATAGLSTAEAVAAMVAGAEDFARRWEAEGPDWPVTAHLDAADLRHAIAVARETTPSRIDAWRRRHRQMTWDELRILLHGLREVWSPESAP